MTLEILITKYKAQFKALNPKYDKIYTLESENNPIEYRDRDKLKLSFACIADTHLPNRESASVNLRNFFDDAKKSNAEFDALLMAGDIADYGFKSEYDRFFSVLDNQKVISNLFLTMGNHDARLFFKTNKKIIMDKVSRYLKIDTADKSYYSHDIKGYTFIVLSTEKRVTEKAYISPAQIDFLDKQLKKATENGKPAFVMCHQPFKETHGLPEVWKNGDLGEQSDEVRAVMEKYKNVFFINGHLHGGIFEKTFEALNKQNNVYSLSVPGYRKENNFGITDCGTGYYCEVYSDKVIFTARCFINGKSINGDYTQFEIPLI